MNLSKQESKSWIGKLADGLGKGLRATLPVVASTLGEVVDKTDNYTTKKVGQLAGAFMTGMI